jgi:hypothetical protein
MIGFGFGRKYKKNSTFVPSFSLGSLEEFTRISTYKSTTWLWYWDNFVNNKLNKILKLNYQTKIILKSGTIGIILKINKILIEKNN